MYTPAHFAETRPEVLRGLIETQPLGILVTLTSAGLEANHLPFEYAADEGPHGTQRAHVARANRVWKESSPWVEALVIFSGPSSDLTPSWYPTKAETGRVVPTYNDCTVHARGPLRIHDDREWLRAAVTRLTQRHEYSQPAPWAVTDAPPNFIDQPSAASVGLEPPHSRLEGKGKVSQNRPARDQAGGTAGLRAQPGPDAAAMADLVNTFGRPTGAPEPPVRPEIQVAPPWPLPTGAR